MQTETLFDEVKTIKRCICGCGRAMIGQHPNRQVHPDCEKAYDAKRRTERREVNRLARSDEIDTDANEWADTHPFEYASLLNICREWQPKREWMSIACVYELTRCTYHVKLKNSHRPYIRERIKRDYPVFENWLR